MKLSYLEQPNKIKLSFVTGKVGYRTWVVEEDMLVTLSDGYELLIPKGFETDLRSSPKILWSLIQPYGKSLLAYIIHDRLYADKIGQMIHFANKNGKVNIYDAKKFADEEMFRWAKALSPDTKLENYLSYKAVRWFGNPVYWGRKSVPI